MGIKYVLSLVILIPSLCWADPFLYSDSWSIAVVQPTHCYVYLDGEATASLQSTVGVDSDLNVYCRVNLKPMGTGIHTAQITSVIEVGGVAVGESEKATITPITKEACSDPAVCEYKYQFSGIIIWYK